MYPSTTTLKYYDSVSQLKYIMYSEYYFSNSYNIGRFLGKMALQALGRLPLRIIYVLFCGTKGIACATIFRQKQFIIFLVLILHTIYENENILLITYHSQHQTSKSATRQQHNNKLQYG